MDAGGWKQEGKRNMERQSKKKEKTERWNTKHRNRKWKSVKQKNKKQKNKKQNAGRHEKRKADVTVVIPNYQGINYLEACLKSLYRGSLVPEIIVVDNGSTDGSAEMAAKLAAKNAPAFRLVRFSKNKGFCAAVNEGIRLAKTEYVMLLNNDTEVDEDCVRNLYRAIVKRKNAFSVSAKILSMNQPEIIDDAGDLYCSLGWAFALGKGMPRRAYHKAAKIFAACGCAVIYRKSVFEAIGYFDENHFAYLEDIDIGYRARISGYENYYTPDALVYHAGSAVSGSRYNEFKVRLASRNSVYLIYKNMPFIQILLNFPHLAAGIGIKALFFAKKGMGRIYMEGIAEGIRLSLSKEGRSQKVPFRPECFGNYMRVQMELWWNTVRRITG